MNRLENEAQAFCAARDGMVMEAGKRASLQILCGLDLDQLRTCDRQQREAAIGRIRRALRVERIKGLKRHWSYDLNRHIALKQVLIQLEV